MGSAIPISGSIPPLVEDIGSLIGLLVSNGGEFDFGWFADVPTQLAGIPGRRDAQWKLLTDLLGTPAHSIGGRNWYALPFLGGSAPIYLVLAPHASGGGVIGVGLYDAWANTGSVTATAFAPVFDTAGTPIVVAGTAAYPLELAATCTFAVPLGSYGYAGLDLLGTFPLDGSAKPGFALTFTGAASPPAIMSLAQLVEAGPTAWVNAALGSSTITAWLNRPIGGTAITAGDLFAASGLIVNDAGYALATLKAWLDLGAVAIGEMILAAALKRLAALTTPIVALGDGGVWVFANSPASGGTEYGLRLCIADVALTTAGGTDFVLQLGKMLDADTDASNWVIRGDPPAGAITDPGVSLTLLAESAATPPVPSFRPKLDLVSIGLDLTGAAGNSLLDMMGVTLGSAQPRFLFSCDAATVPIYWGVALQADDLGIPLGNGLAGSSASNPVAQNLLSSGSGGGDTEAVNPAFSASIAGMSHPGGPVTLDVQLHSNLGPGNQVWIPVQQSFGPLHCQRVGLAWPTPNPDCRLGVMFDGEVTLSVLDIALQGLSIGIPLGSPGTLSSYSLDLKGLGISADTGPVSVSGAFLESANGVSSVTYDGSALIQAADWTIAAEGSYATLSDGHPSMFIFAQLGAELGGPPFFFVTGLCAGFGYNRSLRIPTMDEVPGFPLLAGIASPGAIGGPNADPMTALAALDDWIAPAQGVNWIAAGVQFTSFDLVQSNMVVTAQMGQDFQAALLGVSRIKLAQAGPQFAYAELGLEVVIRPADGYFGASAVLSPNSYILTPDCHLTGGFAFWIWYSGEHAGDFVITLGGYHPAFDPPPHYPVVPRLGFSWQVSDNLTVQGDSYFALTPSCAMGGGALEVLFHDGDLRAWFSAYADFLFTWKPFYFIGDVGVDIGASYKLDLLFTSVTISVSLGADLTIWGPPTGGKVHIDWYIISFTVSFGADPLPTDTNFQSWDDFKTLIPKRPAPAATLAHRRALLGAPDPDALGMVTLSMSDGLLGTDQGAWLARADAMTFAVATPIPATEAVLAGSQPAIYTPPPPGDPLGVRPMGVCAMTSVLTVSLTGPDGTVDLSQGWTWSPVFKAAPAALWGQPLDPGTTPAVPSADTISGCLIGMNGLTPPDVTLTGPTAFALANLDFYTIDEDNSDWLPLAAADATAPANPQPGPALQQIANTIASASVAQRRSAIFTALQGFGYDPVTNGDTGAIAANVALNYPDEPMLGAPWGAAA
ncbi:hypothetical protein OF829_16655 [Sphingomonas sp. LB-2]|uniref:DUF6603 domain-containing protein n=1 Tax=Sphingomonas caeni TaxID=2984949 RepID=UPI002230D55E|nr:DUF6603 domain-containing protein [Sphingomonas caeni]MCW3848869.1 hypothetical protein [Sphingomonas caeni]